MFSFNKPTDQAIHAFLHRVHDLPFSYDEVGISANNIDNAFTGHFTFDHQRGLLGTGENVYRAACGAINTWRMFPPSWTAIHPKDIAPQPGNVVALLIRTYGMWSLSSCRIVYTFDETGPVRQFGFAYGTLPAHVETGEERFAVEWDERDRVWYDLRAWSHPRHPLTRLGYPVARHLQARFRRDSLAAIQEAVR